MSSKPRSCSKQRIRIRRNTPLVRRARMILELAEGKMVKDVAAELGERPSTVILWRDRYLANGIEGLKCAQEKREAQSLWR